MDGVREGTDRGSSSPPPISLPSIVRSLYLYLTGPVKGPLGGPIEQTQRPFEAQACRGAGEVSRKPAPWSSYPAPRGNPGQMDRTVCRIVRPLGGTHLSGSRTPGSTRSPPFPFSGAFRPWVLPSFPSASPASSRGCRSPSPSPSRSTGRDTGWRMDMGWDGNPWSRWRDGPPRPPGLRVWLSPVPLPPFQAPQSIPDPAWGAPAGEPRSSVRIPAMSARLCPPTWRSFG